MKLATPLADTIMRRYPDPDAYPYKSWSYPQGYLLCGMEKLFKCTGDRKYYDYILAYGDRHVDSHGHISAFTGESMDDMMTGAVLVWLYAQTQEERYAKACHRIFNAFQDYPRTREGGFLHNRTHFPGEMWVDGVFMGQMFYCRYGKIFSRPECFDEAQRQLALIHQYCHTHDGFLAHAYSQDRLAAWAAADGKSPEVWSEGLGWYALILAEIMEWAPKGHPAWQTAQTQLAALLKGLLGVQDEKTGLWFQVVDKPFALGNWCDTSGSAMFIYAMQYAVQKGWVVGAEYRDAVKRAYQGLAGRITPDEQGLLDVWGACEGLCVQNSYDDYIHYPQKVNAQEAVCGCLWAAIASEYSLSHR